MDGTGSGDEISPTKEDRPDPAGREAHPVTREFKKWYTLMAGERKLFEREAEVYAPYTDHEISRVIQGIEAILRGSRT